MGKFINFIKFIFKRKNRTVDLPTNSNEINILSEVNEWDLIWAKRTGELLEDDKKIPGHDVGPFIVVQRDLNTLYCLLGTGTKPISLTEQDYIKLRQDYKLIKDTYFFLNRIKKITSDEYIKKMDSIIDTDQKKIIRKLEVVDNVVELPNILPVIEIMAGDIIEYNNENLLVISDIDDKFLCVKVNKKFNFRIENFDIKNSVTIPKNQEYKRVNVISDTLLKKVLVEYKDYIEYANRLEIIERGSIIKDNFKKYLIIGEEGDSWITNNLIESKEGNLVINNKKYVSNFKPIKLLKTNNYISILKLNDKQLDEYKIQKLNLKKKEKYNQENKAKKNIDNYIGMIIEDKTMAKEKYIVVSNEYCLIYAMSLEGLRNGKTNTYRFKKDDYTKLNIKLNKADIDMIVSLGEKYKNNIDINNLVKKLTRNS